MECLREGILNGWAVRDAAQQQSEQSNSFLVGPIFLEVKTTSKEVMSGGVDLFEVSLAEAAMARETGWRFHVVRVHFSHERNTQSTYVHIPHLAEALQADLSLYIGPRRH